MNRLVSRLGAPVDIASAVWLRVAFGVLMSIAAVRSLATGWVDEILVRPDFFFKYAGFEWVPVPGQITLYALEGLQVLAGLGIALGLFYRLSVGLFLFSFGWVQLMDLTNYLNHYYFVVLLLSLMALMPLHGAFSLDARRRPALRRHTVPTWMLWLLRFQVAMVYVHAGIAKIGTDWLLHGQPLGIWMASKADLPVVGPLLSLSHTGLVMSWAGCVYDCTIVAFLLWRRTRGLAYLAVLGFHLFTHLLFDIGLFPIIMVLVTPIFFEPDWPRRFWARLRRRPIEKPGASVLSALDTPRHSGVTWRRRLGLALGIAWVLFHLVFPQRHLWLARDIEGGNLLWHEVGMRFSWRVMLREKHGAVTYRVQVPGRARHYELNPLDYLQYRQYSEMSGQPDLMVQFAHHVAGIFRARGHAEVAVFVDTRVSLNGRPGVPIIDPTVDLLHLAPGSLAHLMPAPTGPPLSRWARRGVQ